MRRRGRGTEGHTSSLRSREAHKRGQGPRFITKAQDLAEFLVLEEKEAAEIDAVSCVYPFKVPRYYAALFERGNGDPLFRQAVPSIEELNVPSSSDPDPLRESDISVTPILLRRYKNRAVLLAGNTCALFCRFCNRKRFFKGGLDPLACLEETLRTIEREEDLGEIIVSGGDPLMLEEDLFSEILSRLRSIGHIRIVRVSSRVPAVFPEGLTTRHLKVLSRLEPIWFVLHINHPKEITEEFRRCINLLRRSRCILVSQTVLLKGVNDCPHILKLLFEGLVALGVKPYYLFHLDPVRGTEHFKVSIEKGMEIMRLLRREATGLAVPHYVVDIPGGFGKVPLEKSGIASRQGEKVHLLSADGREGVYIDNGTRSECLRCGLCEGSKKGIQVKGRREEAEKECHAEDEETQRVEESWEPNRGETQNGGRDSYDLKECL